MPDLNPNPGGQDPQGSQSQDDTQDNSNDSTSQDRDDTQSNDSTSTDDSQSQDDSNSNDDDRDTFDRAYVDNLRREASRHRRAARDAEANVQALTERATNAEGRVSTLESDLATARSTVDRYEVAAEVGLPLNLAPRLIGDDRDALAEDAQRLLADVRPGGADFDGGPRGDGDDAPVDMNARIRRAAGRAA